MGNKDGKKSRKISNIDFKFWYWETKCKRKGLKV